MWPGIFSGGSRVERRTDHFRHLQISWDVAKGLVGDDLQRRFAKPRLRSWKRIAIDEIDLGKRHKYQPLVRDLDGGAIVFVGEGKGEASLEPFWRRRSHSRAKIVAVAADRSRGVQRRDSPEPDCVTEDKGRSSCSTAFRWGNGSTNT